MPEIRGKGVLKPQEVASAAIFLSLPRRLPIFAFRISLGSAPVIYLLSPGSVSVLPAVRVESQPQSPTGRLSEAYGCDQAFKNRVP